MSRGTSVICSRTRQRSRRQQMSVYDRRLLKRLHSDSAATTADCCRGVAATVSTSTATTADCQYRAFIYTGRRGPGSSCYCCTHCREGCCPASWVSPGGGGSPLLAAGPDSAAVNADDPAPPSRIPALYCSCGVLKAGSENQPNDTDVDRKSDDDDDVTPPSGIRDALANSAAGRGSAAGLVMQNTIRLMLPEARHQKRNSWRKHQPSTRIGHSLLDDTNPLRPAAANTPPL